MYLMGLALFCGVAYVLMDITNFLVFAWDFDPVLAVCIVFFGLPGALLIVFAVWIYGDMYWDTRVKEMLKFFFWFLFQCLFVLPLIWIWLQIQNIYRACCIVIFRR